MSDARVQTGAPAAAPTADGPAGEPRRPRLSGEEHQHHAGHHHRHPGLRLHRCQIRRSADEEPVPRGSHPPGGVLSDRLLEELGATAVRAGEVAGACLRNTEHTIDAVSCENRLVLRGLVVQSFERRWFLEVKLFKYRLNLNCILTNNFIKRKKYIYIYALILLVLQKKSQ